MTPADALALRTATDPATVSAVRDRQPDPSVSVVSWPDGPQTAFVRTGQNFIEVKTLEQVEVLGKGPPSPAPVPSPAPLQSKLLGCLAVVVIGAVIGAAGWLSLPSPTAGPGLAAKVAALDVRVTALERPAKPPVPVTPPAPAPATKPQDLSCKLVVPDDPTPAQSLLRIDNLLRMSMEAAGVDFKSYLAGSDEGKKLSGYLDGHVPPVALWFSGMKLVRITPDPTRIGMLVDLWKVVGP